MFIKTFSLTYDVSGLISRFLVFFDGNVSLDVLENIIFGWNLSGAFSCCIRLFCCSKIR